MSPVGSLESLRWYKPDLIKINGLWSFTLLLLMGFEPALSTAFVGPIIQFGQLSLWPPHPVKNRKDFAKTIRKMNIASLGCNCCCYTSRGWLKRPVLLMKQKTIDSILWRIVFILIYYLSRLLIFLFQPNIAPYPFIKITKLVKHST